MDKRWIGNVVLMGEKHHLGENNDRLFNEVRRKNGRECDTRGRCCAGFSVVRDRGLTVSCSTNSCNVFFLFSSLCRCGVIIIRCCCYLKAWVHVWSLFIQRRSDITHICLHYIRLYWRVWLAKRALDSEKYAWETHTSKSVVGTNSHSSTLHPE